MPRKIRIKAQEVEPHGIELRNIVHYPEMSDETDCGSADMWVDGAFVGRIRNDGRGGIWFFEPINVPYSYWDQLDAWVKETQPPIPLDYPITDYKGELITEVPDDLDYLVARLFGEAVNKLADEKDRRWLLSTMSRNILFYDQQTERVRKVKHRRGYTRQQIKDRFTQQTGSPVAWLDDMPLDEAVALLKKTLN